MPLHLSGLPRRIVNALRQPRRSFMYEAGYWRALDDVFDDALDRHNPCHDEVRSWITEKRRAVQRGEIRLGL